MRKYFKCPYLDNNDILITDCLNGCHHKDENGIEDRCSSELYLRECAAEREWKNKPSVTQLISGTRESYLKLKYDYSIDLYNQVYKIIGTRGHKKLEIQGKYNKINALIEEQLEYKDITGKIDYLECTKEDKLILIDHKTTGVWKIKKAIGMTTVDIPIIDKEGYPVLYKSGNKKGQQHTKKKNIIDASCVDIEDWILQLNMYRIMLEAMNYPIYKMKIEIFNRENKRYSLQCGIDKTQYKIDIPRVDDKELLDFFLNKKEKLLHAVNNDIIPELCNDKENWKGKKCKEYCEVADVCFKLGDNPHLKDYMQVKDDSNFMGEDFTEDPF